MHRRAVAWFDIKCKQTFSAGGKVSQKSRFRKEETKYLVLLFSKPSLKVEASTQVSNYGLIYNYFTEKQDSKIQLLNFLCFNKHFMPFGSSCLRCVFRAFYRRFREMSIKMLVIQLIQLISEHIGITLKNSASFQELIFFSFQLRMFWT